jgi:hypothetical protein
MHTEIPGSFGDAKFITDIRNCLQQRTQSFLRKRAQGFHDGQHFAPFAFFAVYGKRSLRAIYLTFLRFDYWFSVLK